MAGRAGLLIFLFCAQAMFSGAAPLRAQGLLATRWNADSFWGERQAACRMGSLPTLTRVMQGTKSSHFVQNFKIAAGQEPGKHRGPGWNDGDTYKWLEALIAMSVQSPSDELNQTIDETIELIARTQRPDGYLHTPVLIANIEQKQSGQTLSQPFGDPIDFEMYNLGHLMSAACVHHEVTGSTKLLDVAIKAADFLDREFSKPDVELARHAICPAHYMGIIELYRVTAEPRYLKLAERWLQMRDLIKGGDDNQDRLPLAEHRQAVGHAVRANYLYAGVCDLLRENPNARWQQAIENCWQDIQLHKIYITGGCGALFDGASPDGAKNQKEIARVHQAYGRNFQLPNSTAHNETCAAIGYVLWNYRMWQLTGHAKYIDALETSLLNAVLAGVSLDGQRFFYTNTLRQLANMPTELRWSRDRQEWISCYCCPPNVARTIASAQRYAYATQAHRTSVLLYGSNDYAITLSNQQRLAINQLSKYPADGQVELTIKDAPDRVHELALRVPSWCENYHLKMNGAEITPKLEHGFVVLSRTWKAGDRIQLDLDMPVKVMAAHPLVEECRGQVAMVRGPLVYCVETADLPPGVSVQNVAVGAEQKWTSQIDRDFLSGVPVLNGQLLVSPSDSASNSLYRQYTTPKWRTVDARLVPYFAWNNRGPGEMTVWIQLQ